MYIAEFQEGHPLCLLIKSVAEEQRIITVTVDKDAIQDALVRYYCFFINKLYTVSDTPLILLPESSCFYGMAI